MQKRIRAFKIASIAVVCAVGSYLTAFACCFNILSAPARSWDGWLGPLARSDSHAIDIGSVWHIDSPNRAIYRTFTPLCYLWLRAQGLSLGA